MTVMTKPVAQSSSLAIGQGERVLLVDDDRMSLTVIQSEIEDLGFIVDTAVNGAEAYAMMREHPDRYSIVVTDRMMPVMDGLALTRRLKNDPSTSNVPVVLLTGATEPADVSAGLEAGAFYYLTKPPETALVRSVLGSALKEVRRQKSASDRLSSHQSAFRNIQVLRMTLSTPDEVEPVCSLLSSLHDEPEKIVQGVFELVQNAVEHGVLRFGLQEKARHLEAGSWDRALATRSRDPAYAKGSVEATILRKDAGLVLIVKDTGPGFDWKRFLAADPSRSALKCGRGIARANAFIFDKLVYNQAGNEVTAAIRQERPLKW